MLALADKAYKDGLKAIYSAAKTRTTPDVINVAKFSRHFSSIYESGNPQHHAEENGEEANAENELISPFTIDEIETKLIELKSAAPSNSGWSPKDIKALGNVAAKSLVPIFNRIIETGDIPPEWLEAKIQFLHKKGNVQDPGNYRFISIENPFLKLLTKLLAARISQFAEENSLLPE